MGAYHTEGVVKSDGTLILENLPYPAGHTVEIILVDKPPFSTSASEPLAGVPVTLDDPFKPVAADDWDALA